MFTAKSSKVALPKDTALTLMYLTGRVINEENGRKSNARHFSFPDKALKTYR